MRYFRQGFTIIELMIVVAIVGILAALAYPQYTESIRRANRTDVQTQMLQIAQRLETFKLVNGSYTAATLATVYNASAFFPSSGQALYSLSLDTTVAGAWTLTAAPSVVKTVQTGNGWIMLNSNNQRCWVKNQMSTCNPTAVTNWDGK